MKKLLTLVALIGTASLTFGQGTINFFNTAKATVRTNSTVGGPTTGLMFSADPTGYYFALFAAPSTVTTVSGGINDPNWSFVGLYANNSATAGVFSGGTVALPTAPQYAAGSTVSIMTIGWSSNIGTTEAQAANWWNAGSGSGQSVPFTGWYGGSGVATTVVLGGGAIPAGTAFGIASGQAGTFNLSRIDPVPEPGTFALAGLGAAALLIFRRRKA